MVLLSIVAAVAAAPIGAASQLRLHLAPNSDELTVAWTGMGSPLEGILRWGATPDALNSSAVSTSVAFDNYYCPGNSTRASHYATMHVAAGASAWYSVSADSGASYTAPRLAHNPSRGYPQAVAIWADMGVECGGVLPPSPGFAGGQCSAAYQLSVDAAAGVYEYAVHGGDTAYNMADECGAKGDRFLDAVMNYSSIRPIIYESGNHEGSDPQKHYTEFTHRLAWGQTPLAAASNSSSPRWHMWSAGPATFISLDADGWIYPLVWNIMDEQYAWLESALARVDRAATPWLVLIVHRAM